MAEYKTPGVYVEEIATFPTSVVRVATAVPVFIGYTELSGADVLNKAIKVKSLVEYQRIFGGEPTTNGRDITVNLDGNNQITSVDLSLDFYLYQSLRHFYANGGGDAYILSVGAYGASGPVKGTLKTAISNLKEYDEPTLLLVPDAFALSAIDLGEVQVEVLKHCNEMQDRFGILDVKVKVGPDVPASAVDFRTAIGTENLKYGASYFPPLATTLAPDGEIAVAHLGLAGSSTTMLALATATGDAAIDSYNKATVDLGSLPTRAAWEAFRTAYEATTESDNEVELTAYATKINAVFDVIYNIPSLTNTALDEYVDGIQVPTGGPLEALLLQLYDLDEGLDSAPFTASALGVILSGDYTSYTFPTPPVPFPSAYGVAPADIAAAVANARATFDLIFDTAYNLLGGILDLAEYLASEDVLFQTSTTMSNIRSAIRNTGYTLPPSGAVTGAYATTDANRGVWKAPANISLNAVSSVIKMASDELDDLNVPSDGQGKSINAIRLFRGQGNLIYGARTLAGNDNEWRYVPVRRLFIMVEESVRKASEPFVFEANNANTWQTVKAMIENFLNGIWRDGGLAGASEKDAYFVKVGLGQTMTAQDILEGKMIVEIGMAAVRPAEFVILKFSHKLQES